MRHSGFPGEKRVAMKNVHVLDAGASPMAVVRLVAGLAKAAGAAVGWKVGKDSLA